MVHLVLPAVLTAAAGAHGPAFTREDIAGHIIDLPQRALERKRGRMQNRMLQGERCREEEKKRK